jgi:uncharacterized protein
MSYQELSTALMASGTPRFVSESAIDALVSEIATRFDPERIVLFGSHALGTAHADSDVDMLVIMDTPLSEAEQAVRICQALDYRFGLDLIVRTPETLERRLGLGDSFLREVLTTGRTLYARPHG